MVFVDILHLHSILPVCLRLCSGVRSGPGETHLIKAPPTYNNQGQTGRFFQIQVRSGSGIGKNFGFGSGSGSGSGIGTVFFINRVLSGNENIDRVFSGISISRLRFQN